MNRFLVAASILVLGSTAHARSNIPGVIQSHLQLGAKPHCTLCHNNPGGGEGTATKPFVEAFEDAGFDVDDASTVAGALDALEASGSDVDKDGVGDVQELRNGTDPNVANAQGGSSSSSSGNAGSSSSSGDVGSSSSSGDVTSSSSSSSSSGDVTSSSSSSSGGKSSSSSSGSHGTSSSSSGSHENGAGSSSSGDAAQGDGSTPSTKHDTTTTETSGCNATGSSGFSVFGLIFLALVLRRRVQS